MAGKEKLRRFFFGMEVVAPWPENWPKGRRLPTDSLHVTLAFLGNLLFSSLEPVLPTLPLPAFRVGRAGFFDKLLFLPLNRPRVVAWHLRFCLHDAHLADYQTQLAAFLNANGFEMEDRPFLPHLTVARQPFRYGNWRHAFRLLPFCLTGLNLYETVGSLEYAKRWTHALLPPFEELEHTADRAYLVRGESLSELYWNAQLALSWEYPVFLKFLKEDEAPQSLDEVIVALNDMVTLVDRVEGSPVKAVSFHGELEKTEEHTLQWEMIVDV